MGPVVDMNDRRLRNIITHGWDQVPIAVTEGPQQQDHRNHVAVRGLPVRRELLGLIYND
jgi:hypothetical protein